MSSATRLFWMPTLLLFLIDFPLSWPMLARWPCHLWLPVARRKMKLLHNFESFRIKYFGSIVFKHSQEKLEIVVKIDIHTAINIVLNLVRRLFEIDSLFLLHSFHSNTIELGVIDHFSFHSFVVQEFEEFSPRDLV
jgi:hypothetical protein